MYECAIVCGTFEEDVRVYVRVRTMKKLEYVRIVQLRVIVWENVRKMSMVCNMHGCGNMRVVYECLRALGKV